MFKFYNFYLRDKTGKKIYKGTVFTFWRFKFERITMGFKKLYRIEFNNWDK